MRRRLEEGKRDKKKRTAAVLTLSDKESLLAPRLWCPLYDTTATYIVYGPSGQLSNSLFPFEKEGVITYRDYFRTQHGYVVPANSQLFVAQRLWRLPSRQSNLSASNQKDCAPSHQDVDHRYRYPYCNGLASVKLSKDACFEPPLADSNVFLLITLIPQLLYCMERNLTVHAFIYHCKENLPVLGACLATLPIENVLEVLTTSSCGEGESYEKLEWLGDAVLKLIQTDSLIKSINMTIWIQNLHEGELTSLRSEMGSNKRLAELCRLLSIDRFILTSSLSRGLWTPSPLELSEQKRIVPPEKVCADVIEAILGLVYREEGYELALKVADELHLTVPWKDSEQVDGEMDASSPQLVEAAQHFTGYQQFRRSTLVEEAFTHPTSFHPVTSSYQRLEWIGDAVLCLAAREWLFYQFPDCPLGDLVIMEASLVANETLAYLSLRSGLQRHLNHRDQTLPARIETYHWNIREHGRGLWGTHPPKPIADVVESLLGAVHVDGGFVKGQEAALHVLLPICDLFRQIREPAALAKHPKQQLSELGGSLLSVTVWSEEVYARTKTNLVWRGRQFGAVQRNGHKKVASVQCLGVDLVTVLDASRSAATNRACAMVLATLERNPDLLDRFKSARSRIHIKAVEISKDDEPESESDA